MTTQFGGMKKEMVIKDRQLKDLRRELEARPANTIDDASEDYSDVLEEELRMMKASFQKQLRETEDKREQLVVEHMREQNEWGRQKKELKGVEKGLLMQLERLQQKYDAARDGAGAGSSRR